VNDVKFISTVILMSFWTIRRKKSSDLEPENRERITNLARTMSESMGDHLLATVTEYGVVKVMESFPRKLPQHTLTTLFWESIYFSVDHMIKRDSGLSASERELLREELHKNMLNWLTEAAFCAERNPANYRKKIRTVYYDTLRTRDQNYRHEGTTVFKEILLKYLRDDGLTVDGAIFDALASAIIERLNTIAISGGVTR
jgi:hypothetical protein